MAKVEQISAQTFALSGRVDFPDVDELLSSVERFVSDLKSDISIEMRDIAMANTAVLVFCIGLQRLTDSYGIALKFVTVPDQLRAIADVCGLSRLFSDIEPA